MGRSQPPAVAVSATGFQPAPFAAATAALPAPLLCSLLTGARLRLPSFRRRPLADTASIVTMNGHPSYTVRRHPKHWGVYLESCWCVWTAFPMAPPGADLLMEDEALRVSTDDPRQRAEVAHYNRRVAGA